MNRINFEVSENLKQKIDYTIFKNNMPVETETITQVYKYIC